MDRLKVIILLLAVFCFFIAFALTGMSIKFYFKNREIFHDPKQYTKEYVLIDSIDSQYSSKNTTVSYYGFSKKYDNYKTTFNLNTPDGSAIIENDITVTSYPDPKNDSHTYYYAWVNKQKHVGYIANADEESIKDNWKFLNFLLYFKVDIVLLVFSLIVFYWLKVHYIFKK